jgi:hypothetical protein
MEKESARSVFFQNKVQEFFFVVNKVQEAGI